MQLAVKEKEKKKKYSCLYIIDSHSLLMYPIQYRLSVLFQKQYFFKDFPIFLQLSLRGSSSILSQYMAKQYCSSHSIRDRIGYVGKMFIFIFIFLGLHMITWLACEYMVFFFISIKGEH